MACAMTFSSKTSVSWSGEYSPAELRGWAFTGWAILGVILVFDLVLFAILGTSYFSWYLHNGAVLSFAISVLSSVGIELNQEADLISAHPMRYITTWALVAQNWSTVWDPATEGPEPAADGFAFWRLDRLLSTILSKVAVVGLVASFLVSAPIQYLLNLVAGAPVRSATRSQIVVWRYKLNEQDGTSTKTELKWSAQPATEAKPDAGAMRIGFDLKPVASTYAIAGILVWVLAAVVSPS
jgi:hypothetical protein